jgi:hypothetical protein
MGKLRVVGEYANRGVSYAVGSVIDVTPEQEQFLVNDAAGCFEKVDESQPDLFEEKGIDEAPEDKMQRRAKTK